MGNVSLAMPAIHPMIGIYSLPAVNHQPEFAAHCVTDVADKAVIEGALAMAWTILAAAGAREAPAAPRGGGGVLPSPPPPGRRPPARARPPAATLARVLRARWQ